MTKLVLFEGRVSPDSPISVQLIKNHHPGARPVVVITWPSHVTECSPAKLGEHPGASELRGSIRILCCC